MAETTTEPPVAPPASTSPPPGWREQLKKGRQALKENLARSAERAAHFAGDVRAIYYLAWFLRLAAVVVLILLCMEIQAEGMRDMFGEVVSKRISRAFPPLTAWMDSFEETRRLDLAVLLSSVFIVGAYFAYELTVRRLLFPDADERLLERCFIAGPALILIFVDIVLFAVGVHSTGSFEAYGPAILLALGYASIVAMFSFFILKLERI